MNKILGQLFVAAAIAVATLGAYAQSTSTKPATPAMSATQMRAERDYAAAKVACDTRHTRAAKVDCLRNADADYARATGTASPFTGAATGASSNPRSAMTMSHVQN